MSLINKKIMKYKKHGFSVLEFIIYFAITLIMVTLVIFTSISFLETRDRAKAQQELSRTGIDILTDISNDISSSKSIEGVSNNE